MKIPLIEIIIMCFDVIMFLVTLGLTQDEVDFVIRKSRSALTSSKPAMVRLTFHDCVGKSLNL